MTNIQLYLAIGIPSFTVLVGIIPSRSDMSNLRSEMVQWRKNVTVELTLLRRDFQTEMTQLRKEFHAEMTQLRDMVHRDMVTLHEQVAKAEGSNS